MRTQAVLCHVYHHALNKRFHEARDLLLMTHLQESIHLADVPTQVLYNRAMAQIGICAFRLGMVQECHYALNDIMASIKTRDILAQVNHSLNNRVHNYRNIHKHCLILSEKKDFECFHFICISIWIY